jgi:hypothetical protein
MARGSATSSRIEKAYELEGWQQTSLVQALIKGPDPTLDLVEIDEI